MNQQELVSSLQSDFSSGRWLDIQVHDIPRHLTDHGWVFAYYYEFPSENQNGQDYTALLFRDKERLIYGVKEVSKIRYPEVEKMMTRIVIDPTFRETLLSDDPVLPKIWKRH